VELSPSPNLHLQASTSVRHLVLPCHWTQRTTVAQDCVRNWGALGRTIIFTDTKRDANDMALALESFSARPLHGDIPQNQREVRPSGCPRHRNGSMFYLLQTRCQFGGSMWVTFNR